MFCTNCGSKIDDNAKFCTNCGTRVSFPAQPASSDRLEQINAPTFTVPETQVQNTEMPPFDDGAVGNVDSPVDDAGYFGAPVQNTDTNYTYDVPGGSFDTLPQQEQTYTPPVPEKPKKKGKGGLIAAVVILLIAALGFGGYKIYKNSPKQKAIAALEQAQSSFDEGNYDIAIEYAREALSLNPELEEAKVLDHDSTVRSTYMMEYDDAVSILDQDRARYPEYDDEDLKMIEDIYDGEIRYRLESEDYEGASVVIEEGQVYGFDYTDYKSQIARHNANMEFYTLLNNLAQEFSDIVHSDTETDKAIFNMFSLLQDKYETLKISIDQGNVDYELPVISDPTTTGERLGIYEVEGLENAIYFGEYDGAMRSGKGITLTYSYTEGTEHVLDCEVNFCYWENGLPNGQCTSYAAAYTTDKEFKYTLTVTGLVVDGIYDGDCIYQYYGENIKFNGKYKDGVMQILSDTDPNGDPGYVILLSEDQEFWYTVDDPSQINQSLHEGAYGYSYVEN